MSNYQFVPTPASGANETPFTTWHDGFTPEQIDQIVALCEKLPRDKASIGGSVPGKPLDAIRQSSIGWLENTAESTWIYDQMAWIARQLNGQFYRFDLYGFVEHMQYTVYEGGKSAHYTWHLDTGPAMEAPPRKFSMVLQLSDPSEYEGGELQIWSGPEYDTVTKQKGLVAAFPAYRLHRVTPVTSGLRRTLVVWCCGPAFR